MTFEENRPIIWFLESKFDPGKSKFILKNAELAEGEEIVLFTVYKKVKEMKTEFKKAELSSSIAEGEELPVKLPDDVEYQSNVLIYTNRLSGIVYIKWFNIKTDMASSYSAIGEDFSEEIKSPLSKENYLKISQKFNIKNQILNHIDTKNVYSGVELILRNSI